MGTVFRATDENSNEEVAIKVLSAAYADDDHFRSRFESEINTLLKLDHPNIVRLLGHGEEDGNLFFTMELVKGQSLHALQRKGHRFSWQDVIGIAMDVCSGLQHAHYRGILHRDIKPANLLKTENGTTKITDFGIAILFGEKRHTAHGGAIGTADYMSPEQAQGKAITERSDLFSLGCVMYALLSGRPPFAEKNVQSTIHSLTTRDATPLRQFSPETPPELEQLILKLLRKDPKDRIGTAQALNRRLVDLLELIKAEAEAQTAVAVELDDDSDEYLLSPQDKTLSEVEITQKFGVDTFAEPVDDEVVLGADQTVIEDQKEDFYRVVKREKKSAADEYESQTNGPVWPYIVAMLVVLGLMTWGIVATVMAQPDADELFEQITSHEFPRKSECQEFLDRFPDDPRVSQINSMLTEIESRRLEKQLTMKKRLQGIKSLNPIEILLLDAVESRKNNPVLALNKLDALIRIYDGDEDLTSEESEALSTAFFHRKRIRYEADAYIEKNTADINRAMTRAASLAKQGDPAAARTIYSGIIDSYQHQKWARDLVESARKRMQLLDSRAAKNSP